MNSSWSCACWSPGVRTWCPTGPARYRLHDQLLAISPALEGALDLTNRGPLVLLTGFQFPAALREAGVAAGPRRRRGPRGLLDVTIVAGSV
jgi:hypothetical protein